MTHLVRLRIKDQAGKSPKDHARDDLEVRRAIAAHVGDTETVQECDEDLKELNLLDRPAVKILHGATPGSVIHI